MPKRKAFFCYAVSWPDVFLLHSAIVLPDDVQPWLEAAAHDAAGGIDGGRHGAMRQGLSDVRRLEFQLLVEPCDAFGYEVLDVADFLVVGIGKKPVVVNGLSPAGPCLELTLHCARLSEQRGQGIHHACNVGILASPILCIAGFQFFHIGRILHQAVEPERHLRTKTRVIGGGAAQASQRKWRRCEQR